MEISSRTQELLEALQEKYKLENQDLDGYLEGLLHAEYINYWDYINLDALLSLQVQRSLLPDEMIFIIYHQITELYFKLCLWELRQILEQKNLTVPFFQERIRRCNAYFRNLTRSFEIMVHGMEHEQFLKFRQTLMPASGFQSAQYRKIEIASTPLINLVFREKRKELRDADLATQYNDIYWRYGATETATGNKTLTLRRFEVKYSEELLEWAKLHQNNNLLLRFRHVDEYSEGYDTLLNEIKEWDLNVNINWPMVHLRSAGRYLGKHEGAAVAATGGTNWQQYLPPKHQQRVFFPELWTEEELAIWGKRITSSEAPSERKMI